MCCACCVLCVLCVLCALCALCAVLVYALLAACCDCCVLCLLCAVHPIRFVYIYTVCNSSLYILCASSLYPILLYIYCAALKHVVAPERKSGRNFTAVRSLCRLRAKKRQKLYSGVKKKSFPRQKTTKTLQPRAVYATYAPKSGRNFTAVRSLCRLRTKIRQKLCSGVKKLPPTREKTAKTLHTRAVYAASQPNSDQNFTAA